MIGAESRFHAGFLQSCRILNGEILHFRFAAVAEDRPGNYRYLFFCQDVRNVVSLGAVNDDKIQVEFSGDADGSTHVIRSVTVKVCLDVTF